MANGFSFLDLLSEKDPLPSDQTSTQGPQRSSLPSFEEFLALKEEESRQTPQTTISDSGVVTDSQGNFLGSLSQEQGPPQSPTVNATQTDQQGNFQGRLTQEGSFGQGLPGIPAGFSEQLGGAVGQGAALPGPAQGGSDSTEKAPSFLEELRSKSSKGGKSLGPLKRTLKGNPKSSKEQKAVTKDLVDTEAGKEKKKKGSFADGFDRFAEGFVSAKQRRAAGPIAADRRQALESQAKRASATQAIQLLIEQGRNKRAQNRDDLNEKKFKENQKLRNEELKIAKQRSANATTTQERLKRGQELKELKQVAKQESLRDSLLAGSKAGFFGSSGAKQIAEDFKLSKPAVNALFDELKAAKSDAEKEAKLDEIVQRLAPTLGSGRPSRAPAPKKPSQADIDEELRRRGLK